MRTHTHRLGVVCETVATMGMQPGPGQRRLFSKGSAILGGLALAGVEIRHKGTAAAIASAIGERLREVLPSHGYVVEVNGPVVDVSWGLASGSRALLGLQLLERGTPEEKLMRVFESAANGFSKVVADAYRDPGWGELKFEPHVRITDATVELWWVADAPQMTVRLRPIPRSELGL